MPDTSPKHPNNMFNPVCFTLGCRLAFAVVFPALWLIQYQLRKLGAWSKRADAPKDRVGFFLIVTVVFGFALGSFAQPLWDKASACKASGQPIGDAYF